VSHCSFAAYMAEVCLSGKGWTRPQAAGHTGSLGLWSQDVSPFHVACYVKAKVVNVYRGTDSGGWCSDKRSDA
jgi:hypothetical protein